MAKDPKKQRVPTLTAGQMADMAVERIDKDKKYAIAKDTTKKFGLITAVLAKNAARIKDVEKIVYSNNNQPAAAQDGSLQALSSSLNTIAMSMQSLTKSLSKVLAIKATATGSTTPQAAPAAPTANAVPVQQEEGSFSLLKSFFTNPAVVAAMAGIVYTVLPKEMQDKVKAFLGGFADGLSETMGKNEEEGFGGVNTALKAAGIALTTYFGAKVIGGIASAITTSLKILRILGGGKALRGAAVAAGALGVGVAANAAVSGGKKKSETENLGGGGGAGAEPVGKGGVAASAAGGGGGVSGVASKFIAAHEGLPKGGKAFWDPPGQNHLVSVGYGHQIQEAEYKQGFIQVGNEQVSINGERGVDTQMTKEQAATLLAQDLPKFEKRAAAPLGDAWNKLNENQKAALISYAYNTGSTKSLVNAGLKDAILSGNMELAAQIIRDKGIRTAGGKELGGLVRRRADEAALFAIAGGASTTNTTTAAGVAGGAAGAAMQASKASTGAAINNTSQDVKAMQKPDAGVDVANVKNTSSAGGANKKGPDISAPIPTPIAARGSLSKDTRHSTAY